MQISPDPLEMLWNYRAAVSVSLQVYDGKQGPKTGHVKFAKMWKSCLSCAFVYPWEGFLHRLHYITRAKTSDIRSNVFKERSYVT